MPGPPSVTRQTRRSARPHALIEQPLNSLCRPRCPLSRATSQEPRGSCCPPLSSRSSERFLLHFHPSTFQDVKESQQKASRTWSASISLIHFIDGGSVTPSRYLDRCSHCGDKHIPPCLSADLGAAHSLDEIRQRRRRHLMRLRGLLLGAVSSLGEANLLVSKIEDRVIRAHEDVAEDPEIAHARG